MEKRKENLSIILAIEAVGARITSLEKHFSNHVSQHTTDKLIRLVELLIIIIMFCFLKWGTVTLLKENNEKSNIEKVTVKKIIIDKNRRKIL